MIYKVATVVVGIIILNYGTADDVMTCVASVKNKVEYPNYKIYIIDNESPDDSFERLKAHYSSDDAVVVASTHRNGGYSFGNNVGARMAIEDGARRILILNPDVILLNDVVSILDRVLNDNPCVGIVGPRAFGIDGSDVGFIRKNYGIKYALFDRKPFVGIAQRVPELDVYYHYPLDTARIFEGMVSGCCFMVDAQLFLEMGLLDEGVFLYAEEYILGLKLKAMGLKAMYFPDAEVIHNHGSSTKKKGTAFVNYHRYRSAFYVLARYCEGKKWTKTLIRYQLVVLFAMRCLSEPEYRKRLASLMRDLSEIGSTYLSDCNE